MIYQNKEKKKKKNCDSKNENSSENENAGKHYSEIDDICQNMPHFPTEPFTNFREEFAMTDNKIQKVKATMKIISICWQETILFISMLTKLID